MTLNHLLKTRKEAALVTQRLLRHTALDALILIQLPANMSGKAVEDDPSPWAAASHVGDPADSQHPTDPSWAV